MELCQNCQKNNIKPLLALGSQPISSRFVVNMHETEDTFPMEIEQCCNCGLVQLNKPIPSEELIPKFKWIKYNEPEDHLDNLVNNIVTLPGINSKSTVCGITYKDDSTLKRFEEKGFTNCWRIDPLNDLAIKDPHAGVETVIYHVASEKIKTVTKNHPKADIIIVRHVLEHSHDLKSFMMGINQLASKDAYIILEVPDCSHAIESFDYTTLWEEHNVYFTPITFRNFLSLSGFSIHNFCTYPYPFEDSLVAIVKNNPDVPLVTNHEILQCEIERANKFSNNFNIYRQKVRDYLLEYRTKGKIALFGAGHLACGYINYLGLEDLIEFVVDDNPNKENLFMPGSKLPILKSSALIKHNIKLCLLSLNPIGEQKVIARNNEFVEKGGIFMSIFPSSSLKIRFD